MDNISALIVPAAIALVAISIVAKGVRVVQQAQTMIIERLGKYHRTLASGVNLIIPLIDKPRAIDWHQVIVTPAGESFAVNAFGTGETSDGFGVLFALGENDGEEVVQLGLHHGEIFG